jgi:PAS domain-containing protein
MKKPLKHKAKTRTNRSKPKSNAHVFPKTEWEESLINIKAVVDVVREPILLLDKDARIIAANESFYSRFETRPEDTEGKIVYELGNGQWAIPALQQLISDILPKDGFFRGFEVDHEFPAIGRRVMMLNGCRIYRRGDDGSDRFPPIILLAMEDITEMTLIAQSLADRTHMLDGAHAERTEKLERQIGKLEREISELRRRA